MHRNIRLVTLTIENDFMYWRPPHPPRQPRHASTDRPPRLIRGCLAASIANIVLLIVLIAVVRESDRKYDAERKRDEVARRVEFFNRVKQGEDGNRMSMNDPLLLEMLANDSTCVANLTRINFFMTDVSDPLYKRTLDLKNVSYIYFYDCGGVTPLLTNIGGMPSIKELFFDVYVTDEGIRTLAGFPNLEKVTLTHVVSKEQRDLLKSVIPNTHVEIQHDNPESW